MNRRGFALLTVLWAVALLAAVVGAAVAAARLHVAASQNRVTLTRAAWARDACAAIYLARATPDSGLDSLPTVDLGRAAWCRVRMEDPGAKLNVNTVDTAALQRVPALSAIAAPLLRWRAAHGPLADLRQAAWMPGCDEVCRGHLDRMFTTRGTGQINLGAASSLVLATLPGATPELVQTIVARRAHGWLRMTPDELAGALSAEARRALLAHYEDFVRVATYRPTQLVAVVEGGVRGQAPVAGETLTLVLAPERLAVLRREVE